MNRLKHSNRVFVLKLTVCFFLVYVQLFGDVRGARPVDVSGLLSQVQLFELLIPSALAAGVTNPQMKKDATSIRGLAYAIYGLARRVREFANESTEVFRLRKRAGEENADRAHSDHRILINKFDWGRSSSPSTDGIKYQDVGQEMSGQAGLGQGPTHEFPDRTLPRSDLFAFGSEGSSEPLLKPVVTLDGAPLEEQTAETPTGEGGDETPTTPTEGSEIPDSVKKAPTAVTYAEADGGFVPKPVEGGASADIDYEFVRSKDAARVLQRAGKMYKDTITFLTYMNLLGYGVYDQKATDPKSLIHATLKEVNDNLQARRQTAADANIPKDPMGPFVFIKAWSVQKQSKSDLEDEKKIHKMLAKRLLASEKTGDNENTEKGGEIPVKGYDELYAKTGYPSEHGECKRPFAPFVLAFDPGYVHLKQEGSKPTDYFYWFRVRFKTPITDRLDPCYFVPSRTIKEYMLVGVSRSPTEPPIPCGTGNIMSIDPPDPKKVSKAIIELIDEYFAGCVEALKNPPSDGEEAPQSFDLKLELTAEEHQRVFKAVSGGMGTQEREKPLVSKTVKAWLQTELTWYEALYLFWNTKGESIYGDRGLLPVFVKNAHPSAPTAPESTVMLTKFPFKKPPSDDDAAEPQPIDVFWGRESCLGDREGRDPIQGCFQFKNVLITGYGPILKAPEFQVVGRNVGRPVFAAPYVGSGFELASVLAMNVGKGKGSKIVGGSEQEVEIDYASELWTLHQPMGAVDTYQKHVYVKGVGRLMRLPLVYHVYNTEFPAKPEKITNLIVGLESFDSFEDFTKTDRTKIGLVPGKVVVGKGVESGPVKKKAIGFAGESQAARAQSNQLNFDVQPVDIVGRGLALPWRQAFLRPFGFPEKAGDPSGVNLTVDIDPQHSDNELLKRLKEEMMGGKTVAEGEKKGGYKALSALYATAEKSGPLAMDLTPEMIKSFTQTEEAGTTAKPETFFGKMVAFETRMYTGTLRGYTVDHGKVDHDGGSAPENKISAAVMDMAKAVADAKGFVYLLFLKKPKQGTFVNLDKVDEKSKDAEQLLYLIKVDINSALGFFALQKFLDLSDAKDLVPLFVPPHYTPLVQAAVDSLYPTTIVDNPTSILKGEAGYALHYQDVLWVNQDRSVFTAATLLTLSLRFNQLLSYLMTYYCLSERNFNGMVNGLYAKLKETGAYKPELKTPQRKSKSGPAQQVAHAVAALIKKVESNKNMLLNKCMAVMPFVPLLAFGSAFHAHGKTPYDLAVEIYKKSSVGKERMSIFDPATLNTLTHFGKSYDHRQVPFMDRGPGGEASGEETEKDDDCSYLWFWQNFGKSGCTTELVISIVGWLALIGLGIFLVILLASK